MEDSTIQPSSMLNRSAIHHSLGSTRANPDELLSASILNLAIHSPP
jgi:hypothetical protein